jgi:hypothetical protein
MNDLFISFFRSLWLALGLIVFGTLIIFIGLHNDTANLAALRNHGKTATAKITNFREVYNTRGYSFLNACFIDIQFTTEDGMLISDKDRRITREFLNELRSGPRQPIITVRYLPESPHIYHCIWHDEDVDVDTPISRAAKFILLAGIVMLALRFFSPSLFNDE